MVSQGCPPQPRLRAVRPRRLLCRGVRRTPEPLQVGKVASQGRRAGAPTRATQPQHLAELPAQEVAIATIIDIFSLAKWCNGYICQSATYATHPVALTGCVYLCRKYRSYRIYRIVATKKNTSLLHLLYLL